MPEYRYTLEELMEKRKAQRQEGRVIGHLREGQGKFLLVDKDCEVCGRHMTNVPKNRKYCSDRCRRKVWEEKKKLQRLKELEKKPVNELQFKDMDFVLSKAGKKPRTYKQEMAKYANMAFLVDFEKHGMQTIEKVREKNPEKYLEFVIKLLPEEKNINVEHSFVDLLIKANERHSAQALADQSLMDNIIEGELVEDEDGDQ